MKCTVSLIVISFYVKLNVMSGKTSQESITGMCELENLAGEIVVCCGINHNTSEARRNGRHFVYDICKFNFLHQNCCMILILVDSRPNGQIGNKNNIGSNNGLAPNKWQAIICNQ